MTGQTLPQQGQRHGLEGFTLDNPIFKLVKHELTVDL